MGLTSVGFQASHLSFSLEFEVLTVFWQCNPKDTFLGVSPAGLWLGLHRIVLWITVTCGTNTWFLLHTSKLSLCYLVSQKHSSAKIINILQAPFWNAFPVYLCTDGSPAPTSFPPQSSYRGNSGHISDLDSVPVSVLQFTTQRNESNTQIYWQPSALLILPRAKWANGSNYKGAFAAKPKGPCLPKFKQSINAVGLLPLQK